MPQSKGMQATIGKNAIRPSVTMERPALFAGARVRLRIGETSGAEPHTKGTGRMSKIRFLGLDVHADTITVAIADPGKEASLYGRIPNQLDAVRRMVKKLGPGFELRACYEAGPTGYVLFWQLSLLGVKCEVIAPSLVPTKAGDKVKTDRRDALKLAKNYRHGDSRGCPSRPVASTATVGQISVAPRQASGSANGELEREALGVGETKSPL
jgi:hypothetical protein